MDPIDRLTELFEHFPGIGPRQARRFVQYLLTAPAGVRATLAKEVQALGASSTRCQRCFRWYAKGAGKDGLC
jgi:recombinational DNA repair protein RecR